MWIEAGGFAARAAAADARRCRRRSVPRDAADGRAPTSDTGAERRPGETHARRSLWSRLRDKFSK